MTQPSIPQIDRSVPRYAILLMMFVVYAIAVPINWLLKKLGLSVGFISLTQRMQTEKRWKKVFGDYRPTSHDVIVSTFAKSGTNWMMQIAHQTAFRGEGDYENIHDVVSWPDMDATRRKKMSVPLDDMRIQEASPTGLRVIKTHLCADYVPYNDRGRYLIVVRDPKEVFVSSYYFAAGPAGPVMPSPEVWFELFMIDRFPFNFGSTWARHTASYWALRNEPNVLLLSFRDMKRDLPAAVRQVSDVMGVTLTADETDKVIEKSSFAYMKNIDEKFSPVPPGTLPWGNDFNMIRQGKEGKSRELLSVEQQMQIDDHCRKGLAELGSDFPYEDFCSLAVQPSRLAS